MTCTGWSDNDDHIEADVQWTRTPGVTYVLRIDQRGRLFELTARAEEGVTIRSRLHREAPIAAMEREVRATVARTLREIEGIHATGAMFVAESPRRRRPVTASERAAAKGRDKETRRRLEMVTDKPRPNAHLAAVAAMYVDLLDSGEARPIRALAEKLNVGEKTVRNYLYKARERGLLTTVGQGKAGGDLTDKARSILDGLD